MTKVYVAGKISKDSVFGTHDWRDNFCEELEKFSGLQIKSLDPTKTGVDQSDSLLVFGVDSYLISQSDVLIVYLSDDISIGGSQEILIAKYYKIPVIGLAPHGGKFNGSDKEYFGKIIKNYRDPFVFSTCDLVCKTIEEVAEALKSLKSIKPKSLEVIPEAVEYYLSKKPTKKSFKH
jgi:hypothetical protein